MSETLALDEALVFLPSGENIHTFMDGGLALLGADWPRVDLIAAMKAAPRISITGPSAQRMRHGLAIKHPKSDSMLFIETTRRTDEDKQLSPAEAPNV